MQSIVATGNINAKNAQMVIIFMRVSSVKCLIPK